MSIINGAIGRRLDLLKAANIERNPFRAIEPDPRYLSKVFVGRQEEMRHVGPRLAEQSRNVLVVGSYGSGKTTFIKKLLQELRAASRIRFLGGYAPLRHNTPEGFQLAALAAIAEAARGDNDTSLSRFGEQTVDELARLDQTSSRLLSPDLRFRDGLSYAHAAGYTRVVVAIDELDKRDGKTVYDILMGSRFLLDLDVSFVISGRPLDALTDTRSALLAAFDDRIPIKPFSPEELVEILRRNLAASRIDNESAESTRPFSPAAVQTMTVEALGMPRPFNQMADGALETALDAAEESDASELPLEPVPWNDCKPWKYWMSRWLFLGKDCSEDGVVTTCNHVVLMEPVRVGAHGHECPSRRVAPNPTDLPPAGGRCPGDSRGDSEKGGLHLRRRARGARLVGRRSNRR